MNENEESASELFEAHGDSAMVFDLHEKAFDKMPFFVVIEIGVGPADIILDRKEKKGIMYTWVANRDKPWQKPNGFRGVNTAEYPRHPSVNLKISAIRTCFEERKIFLQNHLTKTSLCGILCRSAGMLV